MATVWITKYTLSRGEIQKADGCEIKTIGEAAYATRKTGYSTHPDYVFMRMGSDAFVDEGEAKANVRTRINRRLKALDKEREKLLALRRKIDDDASG